MNKQEEMWAGKFGDEYHERNLLSELYENRPDFWMKKIRGQGMGLTNVLEVGCGTGPNLFWLANRKYPFLEIYGLDINESACEEARKITGVNGICKGMARHLPFKDNFFDLVFTCGLLIHIPPDDLLPVMSEMVRCSHKYVMFMEYWAEKEEEIEYRGEMGLLWKRPYKDIFLSFYSRHSQYECIDEGFLTKDDGFDDVTWWLFERR